LKKSGQTIAQAINNANARITQIWKDNALGGTKPQFIGYGKTNQTLRHLIRELKKGQ
jgi:hypothetical protein